MSKKMLIDATHTEETRVVIINGHQVEELDFESLARRQLRGNIYLAKVTRVEPSLQAAFVDFGGERQGFLAFSDIHPDYYQIPYEDRMRLLAEEQAEENNESDTPSDETENTGDIHSAETNTDLDEEEDDIAEAQKKNARARRQNRIRHHYKIQEVIKRGQILLVQVVREERGNKGAALTSYLSLAGRYCVFMPNTSRGGGISRKISNTLDRKHLKSIVNELKLPTGMGLIVRTAGAKRTKLEIKRDYDYLTRLWETIRENTLKSIAPNLINEEGNLVKRSIRDLYNKDISEILVSGDDAYKTAKSFIKMLMPSHAKNVKLYKDNIPLFIRYGVEQQIENTLNAQVKLPSGGSLVIHPTEALVAIDVNSGRATKERNIERTALNTNLEAAEEIARQMRLRDLAGLIVIDFIDMEDSKNNRLVEKATREALTRDRARWQMSQISQFGLMEISRQRRRRSLFEGTMITCNHCLGVGLKRSLESSALSAIHGIEDMSIRQQVSRVRLHVAPDVAIYLFNEKRALLQDIDEKFDMFTELVSDDTLIRPHFSLEVISHHQNRKKDPMIEIEKARESASETTAKNSKAKTSRNRKKTKNKSSSEPAKPLNATQETSVQTQDKPPAKKSRSRKHTQSATPKLSTPPVEEDSGVVQMGTPTAVITNTVTESKSEKPRTSTRRKAPARKSASVEPQKHITEHPKALSRKKTASQTTEKKTSTPPARTNPARRKAPPRRNNTVKTQEDNEKSSKKRTWLNLLRSDD